MAPELAHGPHGTSAERRKLARLLGDVDPAELAFLDGIPVEELRDYRLRLTDAIYDLDVGAVRRTAEASRLLPVALLATIGERGLGPLVCARVCGLLDLDRAVDVAARLPAAFCAHVAAELDPRRAVELVSAMSPDRILEIALQMVALGEHVAMGRFVGSLPEPTLRRCVAALPDADLLRIAGVLEDSGRIEEIAAMLGPTRMASLAAGAGDPALVADGRAVAALLEEQRRTSAAAAA